MAEQTAGPASMGDRIPRDPENDYTPEAAAARREFLTERTGTSLEHVGASSFDPAILPGNVENFIGVAQVPIGLAGPLLVDGEHANGEFYVPMATAEGTLVASYSRGMKLLRQVGGVKTTILDDAMQRAPCFMFASAREVGPFARWLEEHFDDVKAVAEGDDKLREAAQHRAVHGVEDPLHPLQLHDRGRRRPEPLRQGDLGGVQLDPRQLRGNRALPARVRVRDRQEDISGQHAQHSRQAGGRGGRDSQRVRQQRDALEHQAAIPRPPGGQPRRFHVRRQQQRLSLSQWDHRGLHRDRPGRRQCRRVVGRVRLHRAARQRRLLLLGHDPLADRGQLWRWNPLGDSAGVPGAARLLRDRQGQQAGRDHRRDRPLRRDLPRLGGRRGGVGRRS